MIITRKQTLKTSIYSPFSEELVRLTNFVSLLNISISVTCFINVIRYNITVMSNIITNVYGSNGIPSPGLGGVTFWSEKSDHVFIKFDKKVEHCNHHNLQANLEITV